MKSLKQIVEGIVTTSDFKLDKRGRKYKAHRTSMNMDQQENTNPYGDQIDEVSKETVSGYNKKAMAYIKNYKYSNNPPSVRRKLENRFSGVERADERLKGSKPTSEEVEQVDEISQKLHDKYMGKALDDFGHANFMRRNAMGKDKEEAAAREKKRAAGIATSVKLTTRKNMKEGFLGERIVMGPDGKPVPRKVSDDSGYVRSPEEEKAHQQAVRDQENILKARDAEIERKNAEMRKQGLTRSSKSTKPEASDLAKDYIKAIDEARGRPAGAATLAKRAAAAAKPRDDDDEGEHYDKDSGVEADQHIHVQLKKAADSDQKPFEVSFKNGKKHTVSQKVAKDVLSATERLKPEHRKNVHDEIHQSYDNLMSVHRLVARN
jgi:hypothetical protein